MAVITLDQALRLMGGRPGLVVGQAMSSRASLEDLRRDVFDIAQRQAGALSKAPEVDLWDWMDEVAAASTSIYSGARLAIEAYLQKLEPNYTVPKLARVPWRLVISLCLDANVETALREHLAQKPTQRKVSVLSTPTILGRQALNLPVYKLLGNCRDTDESTRVALSRSEQLLRIHEWRQLLGGMADYLKDGGLVFLGTEGDLPSIRELLSVIFAGQAPYPSHLLFPADDPAIRDPVIQRLVRGRSELHEIKATVKQIAESLSAPAAMQLSILPTTTPPRSDDDGAISHLRPLVELVPVERPSYQLGSRRQQALESLFQPNGVQWDAFLFDLELPRDATVRLQKALVELQRQPVQGPKFAVMRGEAGIGKTVVAKRLAVNLRRDGHLVLWCKRTHGEYFQLYRELARYLKQQQSKDPSRGLFVICDDPWALGILPIELGAALDSEGVSATVLLVARNSDKAASRTAARLPRLDFEHSLEFDLSETEQAALPKFLVQAGAAVTQQDAARMLSGYSGSNAKDILCRLWYLLPDTRAQIESSLKDEYFRLESVDRLIDDLASSAEIHSSTARRAYEAVAVASGLGFGVPTEVLVGALQVNYSEWVSMCANGRPLWGLLYPVGDEDSDQHWYFTRNDVVTEILLRHINGGVGHAQEVRVLRDLVKACSGSGPVYREFLVELLVRHKDRLRRIVSANEGTELYELALKTFPVADRTLVHHYAKWITDEEHDHGRAYEILEKALGTADYPYSPQEERREHIHTSMAAVIVQRVKRGEQDRESGLVALKRHLREASSPSFFNLYTVHVQVNALIRLQQGDDPVSLDCFVEACRALERAQQLAGSQSRRQMRSHEALGLLEDQKRELAASLEAFDQLKHSALERFEASGDQLWLEACVLKGLIEASIEDKGSAYNEVGQFLAKCQERASRKKQLLSLGLRQARVDLAVRWRLQHDQGDVDWNVFLGDIRQIRDEPSRRDDVLLLFYEGVACFHLRLSAEAQAAFQRLRALQIPGMLVAQPRIFLRDRTGKAAQVQGTLVKGAVRSRVRLSEYGYDVVIYRDRPPENAQDGALVHCWVSFSLQGPTAEFRAPDSTDVLLPN